MQFDYSLNSPSKIVERIKPSSFREVEILNFDLLAYLLLGDRGNDDILNVFLTTIIKKCQKGDETHRYIDFLTKYFDSMVNVDVLSKKLLINNQFIDFIVSTTKVNTMYKEKIIMLMLVFTEMNYSEQVKDFISNSNCFLSNETVTIIHNNFTIDVNSVSDKLATSEEKISIVDVLCIRFNDNNVKFKAIDYNNVSGSFIPKIYENNNYIISLSHIFLMLENFYKIAPSKEYQIKNYSLIASDKNQPLYKYINLNTNINIYLNMIVGNINQKLNDDEDAFLEIINNNDAKEKYKIEYIKKSETLITDLKDVNCHKIKTALLKNNNVNFKQENIVDYYKYDCEEDESINKVLIDFINQQSESLIVDFDMVTEMENTEMRDKLLTDFIKCNNLENKHYNSLFANTEWHFPSFSFPRVNKDKMDILITTNTVKMNEDTMLFIRENYRDNLNYYISKSPKEYVEITNEENFVYEELIWVLNSKEFEENQKLKLLKCTEEKISYNIEYSDGVKKHILNNNFDTGELQNICDSYLNESNDIKVNIEKIILEYIDEVISEKFSLEFKLLCNLYINYSIYEDNKLSIFDNSLNNLENMEIKKILTLLEVENYHLLLNNKRPLISKNNVNKGILEKLKKKGILSSFDEDIKDDDYYRVYPHQKRIKQ